jgi:hypothetical protein
MSPKVIASIAAGLTVVAVLGAIALLVYHPVVVLIGLIVLVIGFLASVFAYAAFWATFDFVRRHWKD